MAVACFQLLHAILGGADGRLGGKHGRPSTGARCSLVPVLVPACLARSRCVPGRVEDHRLQGLFRVVFVLERADEAGQNPKKGDFSDHSAEHKLCMEYVDWACVSSQRIALSFRGWMQERQSLARGQLRPKAIVR